MSASNLLDGLSKSLFWDVDPKSIDWSRHRNFVIRRVAERGDLHEVRMLWDHYGEAAFREALLGAPDLCAETVAFFANQFDVPKERFRAHHAPPAHWGK